MYDLEQFKPIKPPREVHGNIVASIHHLKMAQLQYEEFIIEHPMSKGATLCKMFKNKIQSIFTNMLTHPFLTEEVRAGIRKELDDNNALASIAINEKFLLLPPEQRNSVEAMIDEILKGGELKAVVDNI
jgi:hypothetical protein